MENDAMVVLQAYENAQAQMAEHAENAKVRRAFLTPHKPCFSNTDPLLAQH